MVAEVAVFTPRPPVSLFETARVEFDTGFGNIVTPNLYAQIDSRGQVSRLLSTTAVLTALRLTNTSASPRDVELNVRDVSRVRYTAELTAGPGQNWLRLDRVVRPRGVNLFGYDWSDTPPVRLAEDPNTIGTIARDLSWTPDSAFLAVAFAARNFRIFDATNGFSIAHTSPSVSAPVVVNRLVWSPDGRYLAVTYTFANQIGVPSLKLFDCADRAAPVEIAIPNILTLITRDTNWLSWGGPSGRYLIVSNASATDRFLVFDMIDPASPVVATALTTAINASTAGTGLAVAFNGTNSPARLAVSHSGGEFLTVFSWPSDTTVAKISSAVITSNTQRAVPRRGLAWSLDGRYLAALSGSSTAVPHTVYDFAGVLTTLPPPESLPPLPPSVSIAWSADGRYLVVGHGGGQRYVYYPLALPYLLLYDYQSGTPVRVTSSPRLQGFGRVDDIAFSPDNATLMVVGEAFDLFYPPIGVDNVQLLDSDNNDLVINGSFEDTTGLTREAFGWSAITNIPGWFSDGAPTPPGERIFIPNRRFVNAFATDGRNYLDLVSESLYTPQINSARLRQNFDDLVEGDTYRFVVDVPGTADSDVGLRVLWNGDTVDISNETVLPIVTNAKLLSFTLAPGESANVPIDKIMLAYGESLQGRASGGGVTASVSYVLSTQEIATDAP